MDDKQYRIDAEVNAGRLAKQIYDSVKPYFDAREDQLTQMMRNCSLGDKEGLYQLRLQLNALDLVEADIQSDIQTGRLAEMEKGEDNVN